MSPHFHNPVLQFQWLQSDSSSSSPEPHDGVPSQTCFWSIHLLFKHFHLSAVQFHVAQNAGSSSDPSPQLSWPLQTSNLLAQLKFLHFIGFCEHVNLKLSGIKAALHLLPTSNGAQGTQKTASSWHTCVMLLPGPPTSAGIFYKPDWCTESKQTKQLHTNNDIACIFMMNLETTKATISQWTQVCFNMCQ